jgi:DNA-binding NarL/FixJ family response regulator
MTLRILIADDHELFRDVLDSYLVSAGDFTVTATGDVAGAEAALLRDGPFDLVLLDYSMPGMNGFQGLQQVIARADECPVALMSGTAARGVAERALEIGAAGFLPKTLPAKSVINAIRFMAAGERYLPLDIARTGNEPAEAFAGQFSPRERQVLEGLCRGKSNKEIALDLGLREPTVKLHVKLVCRKLGARNRTHAAMIAKDAGFH